VSGCSIVIPTYRRGSIVIDTVRELRRLDPEPVEILLVDQTRQHPAAVEAELASLERIGAVRRIRLDAPSIPRAMNRGLQEARGAFVLFLDDDIVPDANLVGAHVEAQRECGLVAGQVLQPGQEPAALAPAERFRFNSTASAWIGEFMGGNFSVRRDHALRLGGFDENFVGAAYRFEAEFACRYVREFGPIRFAPAASIRHLQAAEGGTRAHGHHLRTHRPAHSVGAYYCLFRTRTPGWRWAMLSRAFRAVRTRYHLSHPWRIPATLLSELRGFLLAWRLARRGPSLIGVPRVS
jgi:GT2 family glycosyltransferase